MVFKFWPKDSVTLLHTCICSRVLENQISLCPFARLKHTNSQCPHSLFNIIPHSIRVAQPASAFEVLWWHPLLPSCGWDRWPFEGGWLSRRFVSRQRLGRHWYLKMLEVMITITTCETFWMGCSSQQQGSDMVTNVNWNIQEIDLHIVTKSKLKVKKTAKVNLIFKGTY